MAICPVILISAKILNSKYPYLQISPENNRLKNQSKLKGVISHPDGNSPPSDNWWQHILMDSMYIFFFYFHKELLRRHQYRNEQKHLIIIIHFRGKWYVV